MKESWHRRNIYHSLSPVVFISILLILALIVIPGSGLAKEQVVAHLPIPLLDEDGNHVLDSGKPYSPRQSCGNSNGLGCHNYDSITSAYHFEMGRDEAKDDFGVKRGLPHLVSPGYFGGYACMGGSNPEVLAKKANRDASTFASRGAAGWIQRCSRCHPGGGWMEKDRNGRRYDETDPEAVPQFDGDYYNRGTDENNEPTNTDIVSRWDWKKSGVAEADCLICHVDLTALKKFDPQLGLDDLSDGTSSALDHFTTLRRTYLGAAGYFRYMATAILEFLNLNMSSDPALDKSAVIFSRTTDGGHSTHTRTKPAYTLNLDGDGQPILNWNSNAFDANRKIAIPMLRFPDNDNCMYCHRTSNSRRGFYGFGDDAEPVYDKDGVLIDENYKYDIHKGKTWTEANGETRTIENCVACHARNYYRNAGSNTDLDADHNFPKGNSEMDVRNDLDYRPNARSCKYCHNDAPNPAIPSGHADMLSAHLERWKMSGDLAGYPEDALKRITQTHLDIITCQACHITDKKDRRGNPIQIMYRYRIEEDGRLKIIPYNPRFRYYWKDKTTGNILDKTVRDSIFRLGTDSEGNTIGEIIDPLSGSIIGAVPARMSHGSWRFGEPSDYNGYIALKTAYNNRLKTNGYSSPNVVMVWTESSSYIMSHNTRAAVSSLQCRDCHDQKQDGTFSSLISPHGVLGKNNIKVVTALPDKRLIDEGLVELGMPYMKVDADGVVTVNVSDILYATKINPSLSVLNTAKSRVTMLSPQLRDTDDAISHADIWGSADIKQLKQYLSTLQTYIFKPNYGDDEIKKVAVMIGADPTNKLLFPTYRMEIALADDNISDSASDSGHGGLKSAVFSFKVFNSAGSEVTDFPGYGLFIKIPYIGSNTNLNELKVITSSDGSTWSSIDKNAIVAVQPKVLDRDGYIVFRTSHTSFYAVSDSTEDTTTDITGRLSGGGGGCFIATAAYGSYEEHHVQILREFRDRTLLTTRGGRRFVDLYYTYSPAIADWISRHSTTRVFVRILLLPFYAIAYFLLKFSLIQQFFVVASLLFGGFVGFSLMKRRSS